MLEGLQNIVSYRIRIYPNPQLRRDDNIKSIFTWEKVDLNSEVSSSSTDCLTRTKKKTDLFFIDSCVKSGMSYSFPKTFRMR